jgi:predicted nucleotidyltransferase
VAAQATLNVDRDALARVCAHYRVTELSLFGSAARGALRPGSDIDLLVVFETSAVVTLFTLIDLQTDLSELLGRRVDVVPKGGLKAMLRAEVLAEAVVLYAA